MDHVWMVQKMRVSLMFYISITGCEYMALSIVIVVFNMLLLLHNGRMVLSLQLFIILLPLPTGRWFINCLCNLGLHVTLWLSRCIWSHLISKMKVSVWESFRKIFFFWMFQFRINWNSKGTRFCFYHEAYGFWGLFQKKQGTTGFVLCDRRRSFCFFYFLSQRIKKVKLIMEGVSGHFS
jgi:hypothetical protein